MKSGVVRGQITALLFGNKQRCSYSKQTPDPWGLIGSGYFLLKACVLNGASILGEQEGEYLLLLLMLFRLKLPSFYGGHQALVLQVTALYDASVF